MASTLRAKISRPKALFGRRDRSDLGGLSIPSHFRCPISLDLMKDPVTLTTGITYDRPSIEKWLDAGNLTCPVTKQPLAGCDDLVPNRSIRKLIQDWCVLNRRLGVERIPTPRTPASSAQVSKTLSEILAAAQRGDPARCLELVSKIKALAKESTRNRRCIVSNGAARVLAASFAELSNRPGTIEVSRTGVLETILSTLVGLFPLDKEALWHIGSPDSLNSISSILKSGDLAGRTYAALVLRELVSSNKDGSVVVDAVAETKGMIESLAKLVEEPVSLQATKAALVAIFYLSSGNERVRSRFAESGSVAFILEILVDPETSTCEKALGALDELLGCPAGRKDAYGHALAVPLLVKRMFRVSEPATEFAVSALWKLCRNSDAEGGNCVVEALQVGAFQKVLLLMQVGCSEETKGKAGALLKLLNGSRGMVECIDSMDLKALKRPF